MISKSPKPKNCKVCERAFTPARPLQVVCGIVCARKVSKLKMKEEAESLKVRKEAVKRKPDLIREAQTAFNAYIRARDAGQNCICCDQPFEPQKPGGSVDAGHFRSRGAAPNLKFNEDNVFAQRKNCNRPGGTTYGRFREGVIKRIGLERVEALEANNTPYKWTADELREIRDTYKRKLKELEKSK